MKAYIVALEINDEYDDITYKITDVYQSQEMAEKKKNELNGWAMFSNLHYVVLEKEVM